MRLRTKTLLAMTGTILVCLFAFGLFTLIRAYFSLVDAEVDTLTVVADSRSSEIEALITSYEERAELVATQRSLERLLTQHAERSGNGVTEAITALLLDAAKRNDAIVSISVVDRSGMIVASTDQSAAGTRGVGDPGTPIGETGIRAAVDGSAVILIARSPVAAGGETLGRVEMRLTSAGLRSLLAGTDFGLTGEVLLAVEDLNGQVGLISSAGEQEIVFDSGSLSDDSAIGHALGGGSHVLRQDAVDYEGVEVIAVTRSLGATGWGLVAKVDQDEVVGHLGPTRDALGLLVAGLLVFGAVAGWLTGRRAERDLASRTRAEGRFSSLFASAPTALLLVARDGSIRQANRQASELFGYDHDTLCTLSVEDLVPQSCREHHERQRGEFVARGHARPGMDVVALTAEGRTVPVEVSLTPIDGTGRDELLVLAAVADLTERKRAADELAERAAALARSNRDLDNFAYIASHDLKAPLRAMEQLAGFVLEDAGHLLPEESQRDLAQLQQRSERLMNLLNGLLQYSRIGRTEAEPTLIDLNELLAEIVELYVPADRFEVEVAPLPPLYAPAAAVDLVVRNLLMNAVKHHDRAEGRIVIGSRTDQENLYLSVSDDGPGIPATHAERVFELFQTVKPRDVREGSGMGLALVKRTLETQGGSVSLLAGEGRGATFEIRWPLRTPEAGEADRPSPASTGAGAETTADRAEAYA